MIQEQLLTVLIGVTGATGGCHAVVAEQGTQPPYITYQRVVSTTENTLSGPTNVQNTRVQVDVWAKTYASAQTIANSVVAAMLTAAFSNVKLSDQDLYDAEAKLFRVMLDYSIWSAG